MASNIAGTASGRLRWPPGWEIALWLLVVAGATVRLRQYFFNRSFWLDEASLALSFVQRNLFELLTLPLVKTQSAPPGFIALVGGIAQAVGTSDWALRLVPLVTGLGVLTVAAILARREFDSTQAKVVFVGLTAFSPIFIYYSSEFKPYSLDALATIGLLTALSYRGSRHGTKILCIVGFIGLLCSLPAVLVAAPAGLLLIWEAARTKVWRRVLLVGVVWCSAAALHVAHYLLAGADRQEMIAFWFRYFAPFPPRSWSDVFWYPRSYLGLVYLAFRDIGPAQTWTRPEWFDWQTIALGVTFVAALAFAAVSRRPLALVSIGTFALAALAAMFSLYPFSSRLLIYAIPLVFFVLATALDRLADVNRIASWVVAACLVVVPAQLALAIAWRPPATPDIREMMRQVKEGKRDGDAIATSGWIDNVYTFYAPQFGLDKSRYFSTPVDNAPEGLTGPVKANQYGRVWFMLGFFTSDADALVSGVSRDVPVLLDWQDNGARLLLFDFSAAQQN